MSAPHFALANFTALALINVAKWPVEAAVAATVGVGALVGLINGLLIGFLRLRAFLTTLVMLTLIRAIVEFLLQLYSVRIASSDVESDALGLRWIGIRSRSAIQLSGSCVVAIVAHIVLTRLRIGWRIMAVGGSRRAAYNAGIPVPSHGVPDLCRLRRPDHPRGHALCRAAFGGRSGHRHRPRTVGDYGGASWRQQRRRRPRLGRQSLDGHNHRLALSNGLVRLGLESGASAMVVGFVLLLAIAIDVRWGKWRHKLRATVYVSPAYLALPPAPRLDDSRRPTR